MGCSESLAGFISADRLLITQPKARIYELQYSILNSGNSAVPARARGKTESVFLSDLLYLFRLRLLYQICWGSWEQKT